MGNSSLGLCKQPKTIAGLAMHKVARWTELENMRSWAWTHVGLEYL